MSSIKFTKDHEWVRVEGDIGTVGLTDYAQEQLGDIVFVELPDVGRQLEKSGEAYYRAVAEKMESARVKALFEDLAEQEVMHYRVFASLAKGVRGHPMMLDAEWDDSEN